MSENLKNKDILTQTGVKNTFPPRNLSEILPKHAKLTPEDMPHIGAVKIQKAEFADRMFTFGLKVVGSSQKVNILSENSAFAIQMAPLCGISSAMILHALEIFSKNKVKEKCLFSSVYVKSTT